MKKYGIFTFLMLSILSIILSCSNDDDGLQTVPLRDRGEEAARAQEEIETFLETHFYNYEEFENPPADFNYRIKFDTIAGENADKTRLIDQVNSKEVRDRVENDLLYKLYYLDVREGGGEEIMFPDVAFMSYEGRELDGLDLIDSSVIPVELDLTEVINGLQDAVIEFKGAEGSTTNPDGTVTFQNYGIGAVFIPSGIGYFANPPGNSGISVYSQMVFTFSLYSSKTGDQDGDGVPTIVEDVNNNKFEEDDDADGDGVPNFLDTDDDGDGRPTAEEIEIDSDGNVTYPDVDGDGTPDYLDSDS